MNHIAFRISFIYTITLFIFAFLQHFLLGSQASDIGTFEQFSWLIANGKINEISSLRGIAPLQDHFSLLLIPIAFIYKIIPTTYTLIALQSIALGIIPALTLKLAKEKNSPNPITASLLVAVLLCPYFFLVNLGDFHPEILTAPIMLLAIQETKKARSNRYFIYFLITLLVKKSQVLFGAGLSLYGLANRQYKKAIITLLISIGWWIISAKFSAAGGDYVNLRLGYLGETKSAILITILSKPWYILSEATPESILFYVIGLTLPFLAILRKNSLNALIGTLPILLTNIISSSGIQRELNHHYSIGIMPFIITACLDSIKDWEKIAHKTLKFIYYLTVILSIISFIGYARIGYFKSRYFPNLKEAIAFHRVKSSISSDKSILTDKIYAAHFANRLIVNTIESGRYLPLKNYDYIILPNSDVNNPRENQKIKAKSNRISEVIKTAQDQGISCNFSDYFQICTPKL